MAPVNFFKISAFIDYSKIRRVVKRHKILFLSGLLSLAVIFAFGIVGKIQSDKRFRERFDAVQTSNRATAYSELGFDFRDEQQTHDAERAFKLAIELDPKSQKQAYLGLAELYQFYIPEKDTETPEILRFGLLHDPRDIILLRALAQYYERVGNIGEARHWYGQIVEFYPQDAPARQKIDSLR